MRDLDIKEENEENHSFGKPQRMKDMLDTKEENEENRSLGMPQRANPNHSKNVSFPMPQRANHSKNISISVTPASPSRLAQRSFQAQRQMPSWKFATLQAIVAKHEH